MIYKSKTQFEKALKKKQTDKNRKWTYGDWRTGIEEIKGEEIKKNKKITDYK